MISLKQTYLNKTLIRVIAALPYRVSKSLERPTGAKSDFSHFQSSVSTPVVAFDWQGMTSY